MDWPGLHTSTSCPAASESGGDQTSIQAPCLRPHRRRMSKAVYSGVEVTAFDQLPPLQAPRAKYLVKFDMHVACSIPVCLQWGWVPLWQWDSCREQSHLQIKMWFVAPIRFSLTNTFSGIITASHYERTTNCLYIQKEAVVLLVFTLVLFVLHVFCFQRNWKPHRRVLMLQLRPLSLSTAISNIREF